MTKKLLATVLSICFVICIFANTGTAFAEEAKAKYSAKELIEITAAEDTYDRFLIASAFDAGKEEITLHASSALAESGKLIWKVTAEEDSGYFVKVKYLNKSNGLWDSECSLLVNGKLLYRELDGFVLPREYRNSGEIAVDIFGNEITPDQTISDSEIENYIFDYAGVYSDPLSINLNKGENELAFTYAEDEIELISVSLVPTKEKPTYSEYKNSHSDKELYNGENILYEGEAAELKSDTVLYPSSDKSSSKVSPVKAGTVLLNTIGGNNWKRANQYIKWTVNAPKAGLYSINVKYKQNVNVGQQTRRALYINGEIPFAEAGNLVFDYSSKWQTKTLGDDETEYLFYLNEGENELMLSATLGEMDTVIRAIDNCVTELNVIYRKLLVVLGSEPDMSKDYKLDKNLPDVIAYMTEMADRLDSAAVLYEQLNGGSNAEVATLEAISRQLRKMNNDSDEVASEFSYFKTNIGSLGTSQATAKQQPLDIDYFVISKTNAELPRAVGNFFQEFAFQAKEFLFSFIIDYKSIGALEESSDDSNIIKAWVSNGRDQAQIMRSLISEDFTPGTGHRVKLELVNAASLLPATVAGIGPDVFIGLGSVSVVDYSMRNAACDLREFSDFEEIAKQYPEACFIPLEYMGGIYGLPMSMNFNLLYYRTDILADLGLEVPSTWDDVIAMSSVLSVNNMSFGLPSGNLSFLMMLRQNGLDVYSEDSTKCLLDNPKSIDVFGYYTNFYTNYGFPVTYSLMNRFRTGETPIAVDGLTLYNSLEISAPEIKGLWDFTVVPGFADENGRVDHTSLANGTAVLLLENSNTKKAGWEFMKWLCSAEIQSKYGVELESRLGSSGRYTSANLSALQNSCWNRDELALLNTQLKEVSAIEQVPGGYYLTRNLDNAFRNVVYHDKKPMDVMFDYVYKINGELTDKRDELGLPTAN